MIEQKIKETEEQLQTAIDQCNKWNNTRLRLEGGLIVLRELAEAQDPVLSAGNVEGLDSLGNGVDAN